MNSVLLYRIMGLVFCTVGAVAAISSFMFWQVPPSTPLDGRWLAAMMIVGGAAVAGGLGLFRRLAVARVTMIGLAGLALVVALVGIGRAVLAANPGAVIILMTALMPLVLVISVLVELGRGELGPP